MIKLEQARVVLKQAMETKGTDFVYNPGGFAGCFYQPMSNDDNYVSKTEDDPKLTTGCLIGVALDLAGETRHHNFNGACQHARSYVS